nr:glycosyltransferase family 2 protein [Rhodocyclus tenuis]
MRTPSVPTPVVSVIIPSYNCAPYLRETVDSILAQTGDFVLDVIVVDDGSTDGTPEIARACGDSVRVFEQANAGVCAARNRGLRESRGDFVAFVDHDDYWFPHKLANQLVAFAQHPEVDVVYSDISYWFVNRQTRRFDPPETFAEHAVANGIDPEMSGWIYHRMLLECCPLTSAALIRRTPLLATGGFDEFLPYSEDWDLFLRLSRSSQFLKLREKTVLYRQHARQGSRVARPIDYRSRLVMRAFAQWGRASPDGRAISLREFRRTLASFHFGFGLLHASRSAGADRALARSAFFRAWRTDPFNPKPLAYWLATGLGWTAR